MIENFRNENSKKRKKTSIEENSEDLTNKEIIKNIENDNIIKINHDNNNLKIKNFNLNNGN